MNFLEEEVDVVLRSQEPEKRPKESGKSHSLHNWKSITKLKNKRRLGSLTNPKIDPKKSGINRQGPERVGYLARFPAPLFIPAAWFL